MEVAKLGINPATWQVQPGKSETIDVKASRQLRPLSCSDTIEKRRLMKDLNTISHSRSSKAGKPDAQIVT